MEMLALLLFNPTRKESRSMSHVELEDQDEQLGCTKDWKLIVVAPTQGHRG